MKLAPLLAQYLFANKRLDLPGIGSFLLQQTYVSEPDSNKEFNKEIQFQNNPSTKESPDLISFISSQTGKMKALAAADFNSHLELVQQFLNIGKPFLLEGIGSLSRVKPGEYSFSGADVSAGKINDTKIKEVVATSATEESFSSVETLRNKKLAKFDWKKPALLGLAFVGAGLAIWGGYTVYKRSAPKNEIASVGTTETLAASYVPDTAATIKPDTSTIVSKPTIPVVPAGNYKFVLETAGKSRAFDRYARLKNYQWNIQMETSDSIKYKLFLLLPTGDTTKVLDSLTALNGRRVYIENNQP